ncbi:MAG: cyclic nucleotide-binding domain-containing protein [Desulfovibrio sp.]|nr:cyclic nucleotide-binding domain-containing protein [Desulfovibrio sp.]
MIQGRREQNAGRGGEALELEDLVRDMPAFQALGDQNIARVLDAAEVRKYECGEVIIRENQSDRRLYFIIDGQVSVSKENVKLCELRRMGDFFGEISVIDNKCRSATVTAKKETLCLRLDMDTVNLEDARGQSHVLAVIYRAFAEVLADRLRRMNDELLYLRREVTRLHGRLRHDKERA